MDRYAFASLVAGRLCMHACGASVHATRAGALFSHVGCYRYRDDDSRRLPQLLFTSDAATLDNCFSAAAQKGLRYFGLQAGTRCFAGNDLAAATSLGPAASCSQACKGDASQTACGGVQATSMYEAAQGVCVLVLGRRG